MPVTTWTGSWTSAPVTCRRRRWKGRDRRGSRVPDLLLLFLTSPGGYALIRRGRRSRRVRAALGDKGLTLLEPSGANDTNAIVVTKKTAEDRNLEKVSDLAPIAASSLRRPAGVPGEAAVPDRAEGQIRHRVQGVPGAGRRGTPDGGGAGRRRDRRGLLFSTSSVISSKNLVVLEDDKDLQAADHITPLVRDEVKTDEIEELLGTRSARS